MKVFENTYYDVDSCELERTIKEHLGFDYNFACDMEQHDSEYSCVIKPEIEAYELKEVRELLESKGKSSNYCVHLCLTALYLKGVIKYGNYLIAC